MFTNYKIQPMIAASDIERAKRWYSEKLGLEPDKDMGGELLYHLSSGSAFGIYETPSAGSAKNTVAVWDVDDLEAAMAYMRGRGVVFEEYDTPDFKTTNGIID